MILTLLNSALHSRVLTLILGLIFLILNVLDAHSTYLVLFPSYFYRERNPIARWIFRKLGLLRGILVFKAILMLILAGCVGYYAAYDPLTINIVLLVASLLFAWVVWHNYRIWRRYRGSRVVGL